MVNDLIDGYRAKRDAMFSRDIPPEVKAMTNEELAIALKTEAFIDPFKYLELKSRGGAHVC